MARMVADPVHYFIPMGWPGFKDSEYMELQESLPDLDVTLQKLELVMYTIRVMFFYVLFPRHIHPGRDLLLYGPFALLVFLALFLYYGVDLFLEGFFTLYVLLFLLLHQCMDLFLEGFFTLFLILFLFLHDRFDLFTDGDLFTYGFTALFFIYRSLQA